MSIDMYFFKVSRGNTGTMCEILFKVNNKETRKKPRRWHRSGVFIAEFEQIFHIVLVSKLSILKKKMPAALNMEVFIKLSLKTNYITKPKRQSYIEIMSLYNRYKNSKVFLLQQTAF